MPDQHSIKTAICVLIALSAVWLSASLNAAAHRPAQITVAYFQKWPTPNLYAQAKRSFDTVLGVQVNWVAFKNGNDMNAALAAGDVQIAYSQGHVPFLVGVTSGIDLTMVAVALGYPENDNCMVANDAAIDRSNATRLEGQKIAVQLGSVTHFRLLKVLTHLGVDQSRIELLSVSNGADAAQALQRGDVVMACASGRSLRSMERLGTPLMTGVEQEAIGLKLFDIVTVETSFLKQHPNLVQAFIDVTEASNQQWKQNPDSMRTTIARAADMNLEGSNRTLAGFMFPQAAEQKSDQWMSSLIPVYTKEIADFFVANGKLGKSLDSYNQYITTRFLH